MRNKLIWTWLWFGMKRNWISAPVCSTHDWVDQTEEELEEFDEGGDPCITVVRVWALQ
jgi:hypothetical protein